MRLCSYVVVHDRGFSPNPFGRFCTLTACTPNHQGLRLGVGDWIIGNSSAASGNVLIYAMRISEVLDFDAYYRDPRFEEKKPTAASWETQCGDNIYYRDEADRWIQALAFYHTDEDQIEQDTRHARVFISDHFFYFGGQAPDIPPECSSLVQTRQGCRCNHSLETVRAFIGWLESHYPPGRHGLPRDNAERQPGHDRLVQLRARRSARPRRA